MSLQSQILEEINFSRDERNCEPDEAPVLYTVDADGHDIEVRLPTTWAVCPVCDGEGSHVNPSIDCNGLTAEDFAEDPDFAEDYMSGAYDQQCNRCQGRTTVRAVDWARLTADQAAAYRKQLKEEGDARAEEMAERRWGA